MKILCIDSSVATALEFQETNKRNAQARLNRFADSFASILHGNFSAAESVIYTTGSDGRGENKTFDGTAKSNVELTFYSSTLSSDQLQELSEQVRSTTPVKFDTINHLTQSDSTVFYANDPHRFFPTRIWDAQPLWGDVHQVILGKRKSVDEILQYPDAVRKFHDRLRAHQHTLRKDGDYVYHGQHIRQYNLEKGELYYDPENSQEGLKLGPLRVIQYTLALALMRTIRDTQSSPVPIEIIPANICDRLDFLKDAQITALSPEEINRIKYVYSFFLMMYHKILLENYSTGETQFFIADKDRQKDMRDMVQSISSPFTDRVFRKRG